MSAAVYYVFYEQSRFVSDHHSVCVYPSSVATIESKQTCQTRLGRCVVLEFFRDFVHTQCEACYQCNVSSPIPTFTYQYPSLLTNAYFNLPISIFIYQYLSMCMTDGPLRVLTISPDR